MRVKGKGENKGGCVGRDLDPQVVHTDGGRDGVHEPEPVREEGGAELYEDRKEEQVPAVLDHALRRSEEAREEAGR